jgi:3-oxoadipate enol-lactonase
VTLPYDQVGVGPPVVLLHAGVADRSMWSDVLPLPGFRAIVPDQPGFGEAAVQPGPQAPWEYVLTLAPEAVRAGGDANELAVDC